MRHLWSKFRRGNHQRRRIHRPRLELLEQRELLATNWLITLAGTSTGPGSLPYAVANAASGDTIDFAGLGAGQHLIDLTSNLVINASITIDGATATSFNANTSSTQDNAQVAVEINGGGAYNVQINADNVVLNNVAVVNYGAANPGVLVNGVTGVALGGDFLGVDPNGKADGGAYGVEVTGTQQLAAATIGGATLASADEVGANTIAGVWLTAADNQTAVEGNFIGVPVLGTTADVANGNGVQIDGALDLNTIGGTTTIAANLISNNSGAGIYVDNSINDLVEGNRIGTNGAGTLSNANGNYGIVVTGTTTGTTIGGTASGAGNVISGNHNGGVQLSGTSTSTLIAGNLIGLRGDGLGTLANVLNGIDVDGVSGNTIGGTTSGARNAIGGNTNDGILLANGATSNLVEGNSIGTNNIGTLALGSAGSGIEINSSNGNTVAGNIISANLVDGVLLDGTTSGTLIQGNLIGTNAAGTAALGNRADGVVISGAHGNTVGGTTAGAGNVISGNVSAGVAITGAGANGNVVSGNNIGTDITGLVALGNDIGLLVSASQDLIGPSNIIAFNLAQGVEVDTGTQDTITSNSIFENGGPGIDLVNNGNHAATLPTVSLAPAFSGSGLINIAGNLSVPAAQVGGTFTLEFFANPPGDPTPQGHVFLGSETFDATSTLTAFGARFAHFVPHGESITATVTDAAGDTSGFSTAVPVDNPLVLSGVTLSPVAQGSTTGTITVATFTDPNGVNPNQPKLTLLYPATINWGDGTSANPDVTPGTVSYDAGTNTFSISGAHVYFAPGDYTITVTVASANTPPQTITDTLEVYELNEIRVTGASVSANPGQALTDVTVATFTDGYARTISGAPATASDYTATIYWGDGATSTGTITSEGTNSYAVTGSHTYTESGTPSAEVVVQKNGEPNDTGTAFPVVFIAPTTVLVGSVSVTATAGVSYTGAVATISSNDLTLGASDFSAVINWGDDTVQDGTVTGSDGRFTISGSHEYESARTYTVTIKVVETLPAGHGGPGSTVVSVASTIEVQAAGVLAAPLVNAPKVLATVPAASDADDGVVSSSKGLE